jgi:hypothetical protein
VNDLPPERTPEYEDMVTVFEGDSNDASVARAAVEGAGVKSWIKDEEVHGLFPNFGATEVLVCTEDEKPALEAFETPKRHNRDHLSSRHFPSRNTMNNRLVFWDPSGKAGNTRMKQNDKSERGHRIKERHRQGKRV